MLNIMFRNKTIQKWEYGTLYVYKIIDVPGSTGSFVLILSTDFKDEERYFCVVNIHIVYLNV